MATVGYSEFVLNTRYEDIPAPVIARVQDLILDLIGVSAAACDLDASRIVRDLAARVYANGSGADGARILFDGRVVSRAGAAWAGANQIDSLDAHDGYSLAKGHAGCGLLPAVLAFCEGREVSGREFLAAMVIGYEVASRGGVALHRTVSDYHTSGAWVSLAVAALGVRLAGGSPEVLREAIGIAEFHGPRSQMMREIDNPTMLHDGSGWGAMVGVVSAELALNGFAGAPAATVEAEEVEPYWSDLGERWLTAEQNIKLYPICRWAHALVKAALDLREAHSLAAEDIAAVEIHSFHEATRLARDVPMTTGKAQYSINYPVAVALHVGKIGAREVSPEAFDDPIVAGLIGKISVHECDHCNANFPSDRLGQVIVITNSGERLDSGIVRAPGEHTNPIDRTGIIEKFDDFTTPVLSSERAEAIKSAVFRLNDPQTAFQAATDLLYSPK